MTTKRMRERNIMYVQQLEYLPFKNFEELINHIETEINPTEYAAIIHDKDTHDDGSLKEPHVHVMFHFENARSIQKIAKLLKDKPQSIEKWNNNVDTGYSYLIHETEKSKNEHQYSLEEVTANFDYPARIEKIRKSIKNKTSKNNKRSIKITEMLDLLLQNEISKKKLEESLTGSELAKYHSQIDIVYKKRLEREAEEWKLSMKSKNKKIKTIWIYGPSGTGKTKLAKSIAEKEEEAYFISGSDRDPFQNYTNEHIVILDELRAFTFGYNDLLKMLDPYLIGNSAPARYQDKNLVVHTFIITTPYSPEEFFDNLVKISKKRLDPNIDTFTQLARRLDEVIHLTKNGIEYLIYDKNEDKFKLK